MIECVKYPFVATSFKSDTNTRERPFTFLMRYISLHQSIPKPIYASYSYSHWCALNMKILRTIKQTEKWYFQYFDTFLLVQAIGFIGFSIRNYLKSYVHCTCPYTYLNNINYIWVPKNEDAICKQNFKMKQKVSCMKVKQSFNHDLRFTHKR